MILGGGLVVLIAQALLNGETLHPEVGAAIVFGAFVSWALWAYIAGRSVVLIQSAEGVLIRKHGVVSGPITGIVLRERFHVRPWHYRVSAVCMDGTTIEGALFPPFSLVYSRDEFKRQLRSFLHPLVVEGVDL
jgi:hypothetical protein